MKKIEVWMQRIRNPRTRKEYVRNVRKFLEYFAVSDVEALEWDLEPIEDRIHEYQVSLLDKGLSGAAVRQYTAALKRFFWDHRKRIYLDMRDIPTERENLDYIPTREDVQAVFDYLRPHQRIGAALVAFAGLRLQDATGLQYKHIKNSLNNGDEVLTIIKQHSKSSVWFVQFIGPQGARYIRQVLAAREAKGHQIHDESFIVSRTGKRMKSQSLGKMILRAIKNTVGRHPTGEPFRRFRAYGLRKYFRRTIGQLDNAEAEYLMGHTKGITSLEATYNGLRDLDPVAIQKLKKRYISVLPELETEITDTTLRAQLERKDQEKQELQKELGEIRDDLDDLKELAKLLREREKS